MSVKLTGGLAEPESSNVTLSNSENALGAAPFSQFNAE